MSPNNNGLRTKTSWSKPASTCASSHRRSRVETKMHCVKLLGQRLMARDFDRQVAELQFRIAVLNGYT